jgi:two-component sensor histidine kinase
MLEMQIGVEESESSTKSLEDVYRRIDAMSLVHEMLFIDEANLNLSVKDYLEKLVDFSTILYNKDHKITFNLSCVNVELPIDQIVSIGIICSELLTNSIKYAFQDHKEPKINFELTQNDGIYQINYSDNGIGMTEKEDDSRKTLGMRLIDIFSRQLNGEYKIQSNNGFNFSLEFKK